MSLWTLGDQVPGGGGSKPVGLDFFALALDRRLRQERCGGQRGDVLILRCDAGLSEKRCKRRLSCQYFSALGIRSPKVIANAFSAGFQRMVHRVWPVPLGSSDLVTR